VSPTGVRISGDTGGVVITSNVFRDLSQAGIQLGTGNGNVSHVTITRNRFDVSRRNVPVVVTRGRQASWIAASGNSSSSPIRPAAPALKARTNYRVAIATPN
jgi:hypothetical protein